VKAIVAGLSGRRLVIVTGLVASALLIWFAGPLASVAGHAPLVGVGARRWAIGALVGVTVLLLVTGRLLARRREATLLRAMASDTESSPGDLAAAEERAVLREKMAAAVATLRSRSAARGRDKRFVYELPWYAIIGPPGAGKTTLLANSGLDFPLEETHGRQSVKGVGGTRDCDWWFTDSAVLLDTAGRYATQDSDAEIDSAAWHSFTALLKETRSRRPLNGVLVALSVQDVLGQRDEAIDGLARRLRNRVDELQRELGTVPPVYLVFTKCDLLAGFDAFFADSDAEARDQVWGFTLPPPGEHSEATPAGELDLLVSRLQGQTIARLHAERGAGQRASVYTFPLQFAALRRHVGAFVERFAAHSRLVDPLLLRGVYFTSATQTGGVLDEVIDRVSAGVGLPGRTEAAPPGRGRSYFIRRLLEDVVFPESGLAGTDPRTERRLARAQLGIAALVLVALAGLLGAWSVGWLDERSQLERVATRADELERALATLSPDSLELIDTTRVLTLARDLAAGPGGEDGAGFSLPSVLAGSGARPTITRLADSKYRELLVDVLLPRLMTRLEHRLQAETDNDDFLFEGLKTYLMIGDAEHFDSAAVGGWFRFDTVANLPADTQPRTMAALEGHIDTLFDTAPVRLPRPLDAALVARLREVAARVPLEQRAYARLKSGSRDALERHLALSDVGAELPRLFTLEGGRSLDRAVPQLFTLAGYREDFLPSVGDISRRLAEERWVLGPRFALGTAGALDDGSLDAAVRRQYENEYIAVWQTLLDTLRLRPVDGLDGAARAIAQLAADDSPLAALLRESARQTAPVDTLVRRARGTGVEGGGRGAGDTGDNASNPIENAAAAARAAELAALLGGPAATGEGAATAALGGTAETPPDRIAEHFGALHELVASADGAPSPLDGVLGELAGLNAQLLAMTNSAGAAGDPALARDLAIGLQTLGFRTERLAEPLASLMEELSSDIADAAGSGLCRELESAWQAEVLSFWKRAVQGRYPLYRQALTDVAMADFTAFFGPTGRLQRFVDTRLASLVTRTPGRWSWRGAGASCLSDGTLRQFALADDIRDTFFATGGAGPAFTFGLAPSGITMSTDIDTLRLQVGAARIDYFHGPVIGSPSFVWPDPGGALQASLRVEPVVSGGSSGITASGPWAILKLFQQGEPVRTDRGLKVDYRFSGRAVSLSFDTGSFNPLDSRALAAFRAPEAL